MGGTFDPIHYGHLASAETVLHEFNFDKIIFIPTGNPPHKTSSDVSPGETRYLMTSFAVASNDFFDVSRIEIDRKGTTYTIDTVREVRKMYDEFTKIHFITGADALLEIFTWHNVVELLKMCSIIAISRPGCNRDRLMEQIEFLKEKCDADIKFLEVPALAISSSDIRRRVKTGHPIKYLVPDSVLGYINKYGLYKQ
jgi:nicotinate-nucleotide adenylyltransferase